MTAPATAPPPSGLTGARSKALLVYIGLTGLFILGIWVAFALAGSGVFGLNHHNLVAKHLDKQTGLDPHRAVGSILGLVGLLMLIAVIVARPGRNLVIGTVAVFLLAGIGQPLFAGIGEDHRWGGALHVLNAGVILVLAFWLHLTARKVPRA
ncbi:MAG: hypothetical protein QOG53_1806 [Frankiales bacterium]|jgi:hypothetical protein|nr:hypothetical protein [Frankiales bacterium]